MAFDQMSRLRVDVPELLKLAGPLLVGQLAVIAFGVLDTAMTARYSSEDLAALAMASAIFISVYVGLTGVIAALTPIAGQLFGAKRYAEIGEEVRQAGWLAVGLTIVGTLILLNADHLLAISQVNVDLENKARLYLQILALGLPASMGMRVLMSFHNAVSRPGIITIIQLIGLGLKFPLNALFIYGGFGIDAMGGPGCAVATVIINYAAISLYFKDHVDPSNPFPTALVFAANTTAESWAIKGCKRSRAGRCLGPDLGRA